MGNRSILLTEQQAGFVSELVATGHYQNASEVLRDGLRLLEDRLQCQRAELADIQAGIIAGFDQVEHKQFAKGSGQEAIERAFERAVNKHLA